MIQRYFEDEMNYLLEAGKEYARAHPEQAKFLNLESVSDRDPYVERLFEGFAFLAGRIQERLDDELPEFTESLAQFLWPHFLKPIPSLSILEFRPRAGLVQGTTRIPAGTEVRSAPVGDEEVACRFRTTQDVQVQPITLRDATLVWPPDGTSQVTMTFDLHKGIEYKTLDLSRLRLYCHAEDTVASTMHLFFTRHVSRVRFWAGEDAKGALELRGQEHVRAAGLAADEGLVPYSRYSFSGYRLLQEYLSFRRKFWFVDLLGLSRFHPPEKTTAFTIQVSFDTAFPEEKRFKGENIRLFCTPIVNLFTLDTEPVRLDHQHYEYLVIPDARHPRSVEIYDITSVVGTEEGTGVQHPYAPFYSYRQTEREGTRYHTNTTRVGPSGRHETYIMPAGATTGDGNLPTEVLSLEVVCTNGSIPREKLQPRMITQPAPDFPNVTTFENLTQPSLILYPPSATMLQGGTPQRNFLWKLISHMSFNFMSVATTEALRGLLELYDWTGTDANKRRIAGIREVSWKSTEAILRGAVLRGAEVTIEVQDGHFADEGDVCLFGLVMSEFFSMYATVNSFIHLTLVTRPSEHIYHWRPQRGQLPLV